TRNGALWQREGFQADYVALTDDAADWLIERGIRLVAVDYLSADVDRGQGLQSSKESCWTPSLREGISWFVCPSGCRMPTAHPPGQFSFPARIGFPRRRNEAFRSRTCPGACHGAARRRAVSRLARRDECRPAPRISAASCQCRHRVLYRHRPARGSIVQDRSAVSYDDGVSRRVEQSLYSNLYLFGHGAQ